MNKDAEKTKNNLNNEEVLVRTNESEEQKSTEVLLEEAECKIKSLEERIEADRNAIMQIQFEAKQHKQEQLDLHETYVWRTGLKIEKLLQKTGIALVRSLLVISDYKRMGLMITIRKGLNELLFRENVKNKKKRNLTLCRGKFARYKKEREAAGSIDITKIDCPKVKDLVSVVLPVYNGGNLLKKSIESVLKQTYKNFELIIVNDGSTDKSLEVIQKFAQNDARIKVIDQENKKLPKALSVGFSAAKGEFFTWTSADNIMLPEFLEEMVNDLKKKPDTSMVYGNMRLIDGRGKIKRGHFWFEKPWFSGNVILPKDARALNTYANNTIGAAFMYRSIAAHILEDYSKHRINLEDYDYWMRLNSLLKIEHTDTEKPLYLYRIHGDSLTAHDKELGITKNRYKLMVYDDFRRDFYMSSLVFVVDAEKEEDKNYKQFIKCIKAGGHVLLTKQQFCDSNIGEKYSCVSYVCFDSSADTDFIKKNPNLSSSVLIAGNKDDINTDDFDICITTQKDQISDLGGYRGWFYAKDGKCAFMLSEAKIKNKILYSLEKLINDPPGYEKKISIIICTYLRNEKLSDAIWSVIRQSLSKKEYEIVVVDNAPLDSGVKEVVKGFQDKYSEYQDFIRYVGAPQKGLSYARNVGMWNAKGEYLLFLDDDILADYYLLEEIYSGFKYHQGVGVVGGQVILDKPFPAPKVLRKGWESLWSQFKLSENNFREVSQQFEFPYGADYAVRRSAVWQIGGFRMCYGRVGNDFAGGEETALAFKMLQIGYGVGVQPRAKVLHRVDSRRFTTEHVRKTILAGILTTYRFFIDLHTSIGWTKRYVRNQIRITKAEIKVLTKKKEDSLDIYYKKSYLAAWERLLEYMNDMEEER